jgi:hypothetical protein
MTYQIDNEPFYLYCGDVDVDPSDYEYLGDVGWGGYTGLAEEGLKAAWVGNDKRRAIHSDRMKALWADGTLTPPVFDDAMRAQRSAAMKAAWAAGKYDNRKKAVKP